MKSLFKYLLLFHLVCLSFISNGQTYNSFYGSIVNNSSYDSVHNKLIEFENHGVKGPGSIQLLNTFNWLINYYQEWGYTDIEIDTFIFGGYESYNLIVTKTGSVFPSTFVVVDGHYDTKTGTGTNDNGTGTVIILETARLLKDVNTEYSIKFIHFSMEEVGLVGSSHYVNNVAFPAGMDIKIVFNIDEVGGDITKTNNTIVCEKDMSTPTAANAASAAYTDTLATCTELYSNLLTEISFAYASDYMPFQAKDYVITGFFEKNETPHRHQATDSIAYVDVPYVFEIAKATLGATMQYAVAQTTSINEQTEVPLSIYPNPTKEILYIELKNQKLPITYQFINTMGRMIKQGKIISKNSSIDMSNLSKGIYFLQMNGTGFSHSKKIVVTQ
ncbi:MAG: M20/M25/M40 family metallo-hydrolase [Flavobacteriales bacterium]|nr:M20/M25/M40 family metallo-hydrolase [Flavobacteriales bacterium]